MQNLESLLLDALGVTKEDIADRIADAAMMNQEEAAKLMGVAVSTFIRMKIPYVDLPKGGKRYTVAAMKAYQKANSL